MCINADVQLSIKRGESQYVYKSNGDYEEKTSASKHYQSDGPSTSNQVCQFDTFVHIIHAFTLLQLRMCQKRQRITY